MPTQRKQWQVGGWEGTMGPVRSTALVVRDPAAPFATVSRRERDTTA